MPFLNRPHAPSAIHYWLILISLSRPISPVRSGGLNFISDFMKANQRAPMSEAIAAWNALKKMDVPKTYQAWLKTQKP